MVLESPLIPISLSKSSSNTITWSDFEQPSQQWSSRGGSWILIANGHRGMGVRGVDNDGGIGSASQYYFSSSVSSYPKFYVSVKLKNLATSGYTGLAFIDSKFDRLYEVSVRRSGNTAWLEIWSYRVETPNGWNRLNFSAQFTYTPQWYTLTVYYEYRADAVYLRAQLYSEEGLLIRSLIATSSSSRRFQVAYVGLEVDGAESVFDDFILSLNDPTSLVITGLYPGARLGVFDNEGRLVGQGTAVAESLSVNVVTDNVIGVGDGGEIRVENNYGVVVLKTSTPLLGGETYSIITGDAFYGFVDPTRTAGYIDIYITGYNLSISLISVIPVNAGEYDVRLSLLRLESSGVCSFEVAITSNSYSSTPIRVVDNEIMSWSTSFVKMGGGGLNVTLVSSAPSPDYTAVFSLEYCSPEKTVCVSYPITITSTGGGAG
ncbi:MAG: hypothetical protein QXO22_08250 [Thermosphaera sp.]